MAQELLRHANSRTTLDVYTQAVSSNKRAAQSKVIQMIVPCVGQNVGTNVGTKQAGKTHGDRRMISLLCLYCVQIFLSARVPFNRKSFRLNGGDDGARTRDLCRDSYANWLYLNDFMGVDG
jgi:hypothetical protein